MLQACKSLFNYTLSVLKYLLFLIYLYMYINKYFKTEEYLASEI
jgi:hypothetical protein